MKGYLTLLKSLHLFNNRRNLLSYYVLLYFGIGDYVLSLFNISNSNGNYSADTLNSYRHTSNETESWAFR